MLSVLVLRPTLNAFTLSLQSYFPHCRCSRFEAEIKRLRIMKPVRVCQACHTALKLQQHAELTKTKEDHAPKV